MWRGFAVLVLAVAVLSACGGGDDARDRVTEAVLRMQDALRAGRFAEACSLMTKRVAVQVGTAGHGTPTTCQADLPVLLDHVKTPDEDADEDVALARARRPAIDHVVVAPSGRMARAMMRLDGRRFAVRMRLDGEQWKLDDFFNASGPVPKALQ